MNNKATLLLASALIVLSSCASTQNTTEETAPEAEIIRKVSIQVAAKQDVEQNAVYSSSIQAEVVNNIVSQTAGRIRKLNVEIGDFVKEGQILAEMDKVTLSQAELKLKNDEIELNRVKTLYKQGGVSQSDYEALELAFKVSKTNYENLLENTILRSPVDGVISARNYDKGDMYAMASPIYTVQKITPVKMLVAVSESDYTKVSKGDKATITLDAFPSETFAGSVVRLYPVIDPASHTFSAEIQVPNADKRLRPGMYAKVTISLGVNNSIVIPDSAILKQQGSGVKTVFVLQSDNTVAQKVVELGLHFDGKYEILSGLQEGDKVVVKGNSTLRSGDKVEVAE